MDHSDIFFSAEPSCRWKRPGWKRSGQQRPAAVEVGALGSLLSVLFFFSLFSQWDEMARVLSMVFFCFIS